MGLEQPADPREPGELFRFIAEVENIFPENSFDESSEKFNLVSTAGKYGIIFIANQSIINVYKSNQLIDKKENSPITSFNCKGSITQLAINCDGRVLLVVTTCGNCPFGFLYDVSLLSQNSKIQVPFYSMPLNTEVGARVTSLSWNPCDPTCIAIALSTGDLSIIKIKDTSVEFINKLGIAANSITWSAKGKQLAVGKKDGTMSLFKPDLTLVRAIEVPPINGVGPVIDITWFTNTEFFVGYLAPDNIPILVYVNAPKNKPASFVNFEDVCYSNESGKPVSYYTVFINEWSVLLVFSSNGVEMGVIGKSEKEVPGGCNWCQWFPDDGSRASMHFHNVVEETFPLGLSIDYTSQKMFLAKDETQKGPFPTLFTLSTKGVLNVFYLENRLVENQNLNYPSEALPVSGFRTPEQYGRSSVPEPAIVQAPVTPSSHELKRDTLSAFSSVPKKGDGEVGTAAPFSFSTPIKPISGESSPASKPFQQPPPFIPPTPSIPSASSSIPPFSNLQSSPFSFAPVPSTSSSAVSNASSLFSSFPSQTKPVSLSGLQPTVSLPAPSPQKSSLVEVQHSPIVTQTPLTALTVVKTPTASPSVAPHIVPKLSKESVMRHIKKEEEHFEKEMNELRLNNEALLYQVGTEKEDLEIKSFLENVTKWITAMKKVTEEQNAEVDDLHQKTLKAFASYEDASSHNQTKHSSRNQIYIELRPLDPFSQRKLDEVRYKYKYLVSEIGEANLKLESMWEEHTSRTKPMRFVRDQKSLTENLYRSVMNLNKKRIFSEKLLDEIIHDLKKLSIDPFYLPSTSLNLSFDRSLNNFSKLLTDSDNSRLHSTPSADSPNRSQQIRDILTQRRHTPVRIQSLPERSRMRSGGKSEGSLMKMTDLNDSLQGTPKFEVGFSRLPVFEDISPPQPTIVKSIGLPTPSSANPLSALSSMVGSVFSPNAPAASKGYYPSSQGVISQKTEVPSTFSLSSSKSPKSECTNTALMPPSSSKLLTNALSVGSGPAVGAMQPFSFTGGQVPPKTQTQIVSSFTSSSTTASFKGFSSISSPSTTSVSKGTPFFSISAPSATQQATSIFSAIKSEPSNIIMTTADNISALSSSSSLFSSTSFSVSTPKANSSPFSPNSAFKSFSTPTAAITTTAAFMVIKKDDVSPKVAASGQNAAAEQPKGLLENLSAPSTVTSVSSGPLAKLEAMKASISSVLPGNATFSFGQNVTSTSVTVGQQLKSNTGMFSLSSTTVSPPNKSVTSISSLGQLSTTSSGISVFGLPTSSDQKSLATTGSVSTSSTTFSLASSMSSGSLFGTITSTSLFNQPAVGGSSSIFGGQTSKTSASIFGQVPTSGVSFTGQTSTSTSGKEPAVTHVQNTPTTPFSPQSMPTTSVPKPISEQLPISSVITTNPSVFNLSTASSGGNSLFGGKPSFDGSLFGSINKTSAPTLSTSVTQESKSISAVSSTGSTLFGGASTFGALNANTSTTSTIAAPISSTSSIFGGGSIFSKPATEPPQTGSSLFGTSAAPSAFGTSGGGVSVFQSSTSAATGGMFCQTPTAASTASTQSMGSSIASPFNTGTSSVFGSAPSGSSIFGGQPASPFAKDTTGGSMFGNTGSQNTSVTTSGNIFGSASAPQSGSIFGAPQNTALQSTSVFGGASTNTGSQSPFGAQNTGAASSFSSDGGFFSGLGKAPSAEDASKNVFGSVKGTTATPQSNLFGGSAVSPFGIPATSTVVPSPSGAFSSVKSDAPSAFGAKPTFGASPSFGSPGLSTPAFGGGSVFGGAAPTFGGSPAIAGSAFGGSPNTGGSTSTFGGAATFGGSPTIGGGGGASSPSVFGAASSSFGSPTSSSFSGGFGRFSGGATFGSLSNNDQPGASGSAGFGQLGQQGSNTGGQASFGSGGSSFNTWR